MSSFPASKYARYKRATAFFLDWLLRARGRGRHAGKRVELETFNLVVQEIAANPSTLTPKLLRDLPKALAACQCAITLREHVATFFDEDDEARQGHRHFLQLLRGWLSTLKTVQTSQHNVGAAVEQRFENYYEVLEVDEDFFPDEETFVTDKGATKKSKAEHKRLFDEAFAEDLRMEVACFFMELDELVEGVYTVYDEVKKQKRTMVEATVVGTLALNMANALTAKLQLRYPTLKTAEDLLVVVTDYTSTSLQAQIEKASYQVRERFDRDGTFTFVPGMMLNDFTNVWWTLNTMRSVFPPVETGGVIFLPDGFLGEAYGEERTPEYIVPEVNHCVVLLAQQLPLLYNVTRFKIQYMGKGWDGKGLICDFMNLIEDYFFTREVTIALVFVCVCWLKSVAALQGNGGLTRNVSLTIQHTVKLIKLSHASLPKHPIPARGDSVHALIKDYMEGFILSLRTNNVARVNPLFAGSQMVSNQMEYLIPGSGAAMMTPKVPAFCHLYNALVNEGFLEPIQFFDELLELYGEMIFARSSRDAAVHGSYNRVFLLSSGYPTSKINAVYEDEIPLDGAWIKERKKPYTNSPSLIYRLLWDDDMEFLRGSSPKTMLKKAADTCTKELFETRVLSRDLLTLSDDVTDALLEICDALEQERPRRDILATMTSREPTEIQLNDALVYAVMIPQLALMDALQPDGSMDESVVPATMRVSVAVAVTGDWVRSKCRLAAAVIRNKFATSALVCEQRYFTFPSQPDLVNQEFGTVSFMEKTQNADRERVFGELMQLMKTRNGPLTGCELDCLKSEIKKDPELMGVFTHCTQSTSEGTCDELCTLLHQAAAGPAHDVELVEWMIAMGALFTQPLHCRKEPRQRDLTCPRSDLPNTMAVHSAVIAGYANIVRVLLEADNLVDMNTQTFHTKETLAHLAVKRGDWRMLEVILDFGVDLRIKDGNGKRVCDITTDRRWARRIAAIETQIEECCRRGRGRKQNLGVSCQYVTRRAEKLRKLVSAQRDEERSNNVDDNTRVGSKKKKKHKKRGSTSNLRPFPVSATDASSDSAEVPKKRSPSGFGREVILQESLQNTAATFARLRDPTVPAVDKVGEMQRVCRVIQKLDEATEVLSDPNKMIGSCVQTRITVSLESCRVIHMMRKFYDDHPASNIPDLAPLRDLCAVTLDFTKLVVRTARICVSVGRAPQALEILDLLEKRLLKMPYSKRHPSEFREMAQTYSKGRKAMGLSRASSPANFRRLEWYLTSAVNDEKLQFALDKIAGRPLYFKLVTIDPTEQHFCQFKIAVEADPALESVATSTNYVAYGGASKEDLSTIRELVLGVARHEGIQFDDYTSQLCAPTVYIENFVFSAAGIHRGADAA